MPCSYTLFTLCASYFIVQHYICTLVLLGDPSLCYTPPPWSINVRLFALIETFNHWNNYQYVKVSAMRPPPRLKRTGSPCEANGVTSEAVTRHDANYEAKTASPPGTACVFAILPCPAVLRIGSGRTQCFIEPALEIVNRPEGMYCTSASRSPATSLAWEFNRSKYQT